jgi:hypothetical protein
VTDSAGNLIIPREIERYVASLEKVYNHQKQDFLQTILVNSVFKTELTFQDGWDGGRYGFTLRLMIPDSIFVKVIEKKEEYEQLIAKDINRLIVINGEFIEKVCIEMMLVSDDDWRQKSGRLLLPHKEVTKNALTRIWGEDNNKIKIFLSHKAEYKKETADLKEHLERWGFSCFVAHEDIQPTKEWQNEIENALFSMDVLLALMTENFHDSDWTDQEMGVAVGRGVFTIPVKMGKDPYGFIGKYQAIIGSWQKPILIVRGIYDVLASHNRFKDIMFKSLILNLEKTISFEGSHFLIKEVLPYFKMLDTNQVNEIKQVFEKNDQMHGCYIVRRDLPNVLHTLTGREYKIANRTFIEDRPQVTTKDELPF